MSIKILVADDSASDRLLITSLLSHHSVLTACDGLEVLRKLDEHDDIDLLVLDLHMPHMDGFSVLKQLKASERTRHLRTVILTSHDEPDHEIQGLKMGAVDFIRKPIQMDAIRARIDVHAELIQVQRAFEQRLQDQALTFDTIFKQAPIGIAIAYGADPDEIDDNPVMINPALERITGRSAYELVRKGWAAITHPDDLDSDLSLYNKMLSGEIEGYSLDKRLIRPDGSIVWVYLVVAPLTLSHRQRFNHICLIQDITRRKAVEQALSESVRSKSVLLSHLPGMAYRCQYDRDWTMEYVSEGCLELTGYPTSSLIGNRDLSFNDLIAPEYREILWEKWKQVLAERKPFKDEYEIVTRAGVRKWVIEMGQGLFDSRGRIEALEGIILDISDRKEMEHALKYSNEHDAWTGLYNRRYLEMLLGRDERKPEPLKRALVGINLGSLQALNRVYGFHYTWDLIKRVSDTLAGFCSEGRQLFSMYEHHFAFYLKGYGDRKDLNGFCFAVATALRQLLTVERIDIGIGVIEIDEQNSLSAEQFFKSLLIASEKALEFYDDDKVCFFDRDMEKGILREEEIKRELALAADGKADERLVLQYQPILDLVTDRVCGFEALARFDSRGFGRISPLEFIPIAEETKLIVPLGYQIIRKALQFLQTLQSNGYSNLHISINISAIQLLRGDFLPALERIVRDTGVSPECINLEITESILAVNYQEINTILGDLQALGMQIAIDDFGTGYSSLARERELNVNCLKIDKRFIDKLMHLDPEQAITGDIISMAHKLGHCVVAEGVEHESQRQYLKAHGCDKIQGYLVSRPLDPDAALELLSAKARMG